MSLDALMGDARAAVLPTSEQTMLHWAALVRVHPPPHPPSSEMPDRGRRGGGNHTSPQTAERRAAAVLKPA